MCYSQGRSSRRWMMTSLLKRRLWRYVLMFLYIILIVITVRLMLINPCYLDDGILTPEPEDSMSTTTTVITAETALRYVRVNWDRVQIARLKDHRVNRKQDNEVKSYSYNHSVSQKIPYARDVLDTRPSGCGSLMYLSEFPPVSLILTLYEEHVSVILRALYSIHNRTPPKLIQEIIIVIISQTNTDFINSEVLSRFPKITIMRSDHELGVIGARNLAVQNSKSPLLVFIHLPMEVNHNWLPPLLEPVVLNPKVVSSPMVDTVDRNNFTYWYKADSLKYRTGFNWYLEEQKFERLASEQKYLHLPFISPVVEFRAFAIDRSHLMDLEGFKTNLDLQSRGHQIDFSVKVWLCGGQILCVPCSKIGFINDRLPITHGDRKNYQLLTERWFDEFGELFTTGYDSNLDNQKDRHSALQMKDKLVCKPFRWYLDKISPELIVHHAPYKRRQRLGVIQSVRCKFCASVTRANVEQSDRLIGLENCSNPITDMTSNMHLMGDGRLQLTVDNLCLALNQRGLVRFQNCSSLNKYQVWEYNNISQTLHHREKKKYFKATPNCRKAYFVPFQKQKRSNESFLDWLLVNNTQDLLELNSTTLTESGNKQTPMKSKSRTYPAN